MILPIALYADESAHLPVKYISNTARTFVAFDEINFVISHVVTCM